MNILITGSTGFVGRNLINFFFDENYTISSLDRCINKCTKISRAYTWNDISDVDFNSYHTIIHLAGKAHDVKNKSDASVYFETNTELTKQIYDKFVESKSQQFIYFSSVKAVADAIDGVLDESITPNPIGPYGESKYQAEQYIMNRIRSNKTVYILRPCMIHGEGNKGNLNLLYNLIKKGIPYPLGRYGNERSFISFDNLFYLVNLLINSRIDSGVYNLADDNSLSTVELVKIINETLGKNGKVWNIPPLIISCIAKIGDIIPLPINSQKLRKLTENYVVSNDKIKLALGIKKLPLSSKEGIVKTIKSFNCIK